jgi:thiosulfate dehydrogenase (quinone) large subunit
MSKEENTSNGNTLALIYGSLLLRVWLGVRAVQTGLEKYAGTRSGAELVKVDGAANEEGLTAGASAKFYALENYHGVPKQVRG